MGKEGLIEADLEVTEVEGAQLDPLAGGVWRQRHNALKVFCHDNTWNVTMDVHLSPAVASLSAEPHFPQQKTPPHSLAPWLHPSGGAVAGLRQRCGSPETEVSSTAAAREPEGRLLPWTRGSVQASSWVAAFCWAEAVPLGLPSWSIVGLVLPPVIRSDAGPGRAQRPSRCLQERDGMALVSESSGGEGGRVLPAPGGL